MQSECVDDGIDAGHFTPKITWAAMRAARGAWTTVGSETGLEGWNEDFYMSKLVLSSVPSEGAWCLAKQRRMTQPVDDPCRARTDDQPCGSLQPMPCVVSYSVLVVGVGYGSLCNNNDSIQSTPQPLGKPI